METTNAWVASPQVVRRKKIQEFGNIMFFEYIIIFKNSKNQNLNKICIIKGKHGGDENVW